MRRLATMASAVLGAACTAGGLPPETAQLPAGVDPGTAALNVTCGGPAFPAAVIGQVGAAESADGPEAAALRALLRMPEARDLLPGTGWTLAVRQETLVVFIAPAPPGSEPPLVEATLELVDGAWQTRGFGQCWPQADVGPGLGLASYRVAPHEELSPEVTEIDVLVTERACNSGADARGRVVRPGVILGAESVTVVFAVVPRGGDHDCPSNPETPVLLELPEPLGDRQLLDGSSVPPRDATTCPDIAVCP
jgi:hypothetical protein